MEQRELKLGKYRHFKGYDRIYEVIAVATDTETKEKLVIYKSLYETQDKKIGEVWARPYDMFLEEVPKEKENPNNQKYRFEYIGE